MWRHIDRSFWSSGILHLRTLEGFRQIMSHSHRMICQAIVAMVTINCVSMLEAGIIRHDRNDSDYTTQAANLDFAAVGIFQSDKSASSETTTVRGSGTLISHEWVLTSAHLSLGPSGRTFTVGGQTRAIVQIIRHPNWVVSPIIGDGADLMLIKLDAPVFEVTPASLISSNQSLVGQIATYTGYGETGDGFTGNVSGSAGTARAGENSIDQAGGIVGGIDYSENLVFADFDQPANATTNIMGSTAPKNFEYLPALYDSGGGVFIDDGGQQVMAALNSIVLLFNKDGGGGSWEYGDVIGATVIGPYLNWIEQMGTPSLLLGDADNDLLVTGADLIAIQENFGIIGSANGLLLGDADDNGMVTGTDIITVQQNYGSVVSISTSPTAPVGGIPEPATAIILTLAASLVTHRCCTRTA